jgi:hypothetical protein
MKISKRIYNKLKIDEAKLTQLLMNGLEEWEGCRCMCDNGPKAELEAGIY